MFARFLGYAATSEHKALWTTITWACTWSSCPPDESSQLTSRPRLIPTASDSQQHRWTYYHQFKEQFNNYIQSITCASCARFYYIIFGQGIHCRIARNVRMKVFWFQWSMMIYVSLSIANQGSPKRRTSVQWSLRQWDSCTKEGKKVLLSHRLKSEENCIVRPLILKKIFIFCRNDFN